MSVIDRESGIGNRESCDRAVGPLSRMLLLSVAVAAFTSCDLGIFGGPSGPGLFGVTLTSPYGPDGAAVVELTDAPSLGVVAVELGQSFYEHEGSTTRAVVVMATPGEIYFTAHTEDLGELPTVTLVQVADGEDQLREDLSGYDVQIERIEAIASKNQVKAP
jgi:hypothetical protein